MTLNTSYKTCMPASARQNHGGMRSTYVGCSHGRQLGIGVVRRCDLDDIGGDDVQTVEAPQNRPQLARRPATRLRRASCRRESRVNGVDLEKKNGRTRFLSANGVAGERTSMERYTGLSPTVSRIFWMIPSVPVRGPKQNQCDEYVKLSRARTYQWCQSHGPRCAGSRMRHHLRSQLDRRGWCGWRHAVNDTIN